jgi:hypothetical protein
MPDSATPATDAGPAEERRDEEDGTGDASPPYDCPYCDRQFHREPYLSLHRGQDHAGVLTDDERAAFETAREAEAEELRLFRLKAVAALVFIYFGFLMVYAFSL